MASSSLSTAHMAAALGDPPSDKLNQDNFLFWKAQVLPTLRGAQVTGLLDGSEVKPEKTLEVEDEEKKKKTVPNPAYTAWIARDQQVVSFLLKSMTKDVLAHVLELETAEEIWAAITAMFSTASRSKVTQLRSALNNTKKKSLTAAQYITTMKGF